MRVVLEARWPRTHPGLLAGSLALLTACGGQAELAFAPASLDFGVVDFTDEVPDEGLSPIDLRITNAGGGDPTVTLEDFPFDLLCATGFSGAPAELGPLAAGEELVFRVGVCAYDAEGGRDTERTGTLTFAADGARATVPWSFTPTADLSAGGDSGL